MKLNVQWLGWLMSCALTFTFVNPLLGAEGLSDILHRFSNLDFNDDGVLEIESIQSLDTEDVRQEIPTDAKLLLVIVEPRLLTNDRNSTSQARSLIHLLNEYEECLRADGWYPVFVQMKIHASEAHQDGWSVLALRRLFQNLKQTYHSFAGTIFIGSFPEPMIVRRWIWKRSDRAVSFGELTFNSKGSPSAEFLAIRPELISKRSDIVLCDLDGNWEAIYVNQPTVLESITVMPEEQPVEKNWPNWEMPFVTRRFAVSKRTYSDFFFINDSNYEYESLPDGSVRFKGSSNMRVPETGGADRGLPNPIAVPDIMVSRINPLHVAVQQAASNLDSEGKPKSVSKDAGSPMNQFHRDPALELRLLKEYLIRNISHRQGQTSNEANRVALLTTDLHTPSKSYFSSTVAQLGRDLLAFPNATAVDCAKFLTTPAIVKGISAHSNPATSVLMKGYKQADLDAITGGSYWHWKESGDSHIPTYNDKSVRDSIHFGLLRTMWENGKLVNTGPTFFVHGGCEAMCPIGADRFPYNSMGYSDHTQIAECLMYYGNGIALIGRAKVYFDIPTGFGEVFTPDCGNFGDVLKEYYRNESSNSSLAKSVASRNRAYFWSILGDWTLRMKY
ncbi:MAG: hypothetical protein U0930_26120 [Pirellulales bacterium]